MTRLPLDHSILGLLIVAAVPVGSTSCATFTNTRADLDAGCIAGDGDDCLSLGYMMLKGQGGRIDSEGALESFERSCELGNSIGCKKAGDLWSDGVAGVANPRKAHEYHLRARSLDARRSASR